MNLELLKEIEELKSDRKSYTEISDVTGLTKATIVLSLRLKAIFESYYADKLSSLISQIELLTSSTNKLKENLTDKKVEIKRLSSLIDIDFEKNVLIDKDKYKTLQDDLVNYKKEVNSLSRQIRNEKNYIYNLTFLEKLHVLFA